jgi:hypothetical protein
LAIYLPKEKLKRIKKKKAKEQRLNFLAERKEATTEELSDYLRKITQQLSFN